MKNRGANVKTFKLKSLEIMENKDERIQKKSIPLTDGLIINREDEQGWLVEAYLDRSYEAYFKNMAQYDELMIKVKITREENDPAFFITKIVSVNLITDEKINVLFQGRIVDQGKSRIEELLEKIIEEGYQGASLLKKFKERI